MKSSTVHADHPPDPPIFFNPSGRRWKRLRAGGLILLAAVAVLGAVVVPHIVAAPALRGAPPPTAPSRAALGHVPAIGDGPLVRVVRLQATGGHMFALDPFTHRRLAELSATDAALSAGAGYAMQRYGYSEAAHKTISLTFDDGPDPVYTPKLLDLLSAHHVPATFFTVGERMAHYPQIVRRMVREGFAVGDHSLTHVDVSGTSSFRQQAEMAVTDHIFRAITGRYASYFRLPYETDAAPTVESGVSGILRAQQFGYLVVSHDFDPEDWAYDSGQKRGAIPLPPLGQQDNITVLLHDGGGDRTRTLQYVARLITAARAAGYTFQTLPQVLPDVAAHTGPAKVTVWDVAALHVTYAVFIAPGTVQWALFALALITMLGLGLLYTVLAVVRACRRPGPALLGTPGVSVLIAAYNEQLVIGRTLECLLRSDHPVTEVIVVDDGSTDGTAAVVRDVAARDGRVRLLQQPNGGKCTALNRGFAAAREEFVVTLDADTLFTPATIGHLVARFHAPDVGAVAGVIKVGNYARNLVTRWQALEYLTQIGVERSASALLNAVMVIPGACAAWRRSAVQQAGGYSAATIAEDCDLTLELHRLGWRVEQADRAVAYTEAPETLDVLLRQRVRWMFGTCQAIWRHRGMLLRPRYGWLGMLVMPMAALTLVLPLIFLPLTAAAVGEMVIEQGPVRVLLYFGLFAAIYGVMAVVAVRLMHERAAHLVMVPVYRLIYEPLRAYLLYVSLGTALRGVRLGWNKAVRTAHMDIPQIGTAQPAAAPVPAHSPYPALTGSVRRVATAAERPSARGIRGRCPQLLAAAVIVVLVGLLAVGPGTPPPQAGGSFVAGAWLPVWDDRGTASLAAAIDVGRVTEVSPAWATVQSDGSLALTPPSPEETSRMTAPGVQMIPVVQNTDGAGVWQAELMATILGDPDLARAHREALVQTALQQKWRGIDLDYENLPSTVGQEWIDFLTQLSADLHSHDLVLSVDVPARVDDSTDASTAAYDFARIGAVADEVRLLAYDYSWSGSAPGSVAPLSWVRSVIDYAVRAVPRDKLMLGLASFGYDWVGNSGTDLQATDAVALAQRVGATPVWDAATGSMTFQYVESGRQHTVWYEDARSMAAKQELAVRARLRGVVVWRLGGEDPNVWTSVARASNGGAL